MGFTKEFNARTADQAGMIIPVVISLFMKTNHLISLQNTTSCCSFEKAAGVEKGSGTPNKN